MTRRSLHGPILILALLGAGASFVGVLAPAPREARQPVDGIPVSQTAIPGASTVPAEAGAREGATGTAADVLLGAPAAGAAGAPSSPVASSRATARATTLPRPVAPAATPKRRPLAVQYAIRATWYCGAGSRCTRGYPAGGMYAAISPDLRTWTGRLVRVSYRGRSVTVRIIDCNCQAEHAIDLYSAAYARLAPLSTGVITVTLELLP